MFRRILVLALLLPLVLAGLTGCSKKAKNYDQAADEAVVVDGDARVDASGGDASYLNPVLASDSVSSDICALVFNGLLRYNPKLELEGELAESWEVKDGGKTLIFHLRKGVLWQDGQPFSSADVLFTYQCLMDPKLASPRKGPFELVAKLEAPDPSTVVVRYKQAFAPALESWGQGILPKHLLQGKDLLKDPFNQSPVGTGPYKFVRWAPNQSIELAAHDAYFEGRPHIRRYLMRIIKEESTRLMELKAQGIDSMTLSPDQYKNQVKGSEALVKTYRYPSLNSYSYLGFNHEKPLFKDKRVRMALARAIDRQALIDAILLGLGLPCTGPYSPGMPAYNKDVKAVPYDLSAAAKLLDEAGWKLGPKGVRIKDGQELSFAIQTNQGNPVREKIAVVMQQQFKKLGVEAKVQTLEWSLFIKEYIDKKNFDAVVMGWQLSLDPDIYDLWHSSKNHPREFNFLSYKNPQVDRLLEQGRTTFEPQRRKAIYQQVHALIAADEPMAFLFAGDELFAMNKRFRGLLVTDTGVSWYWQNRWYVPKSIQLYP
jgi:peptide/nickel transport system substrate-binding protein